MTVLEENKPKGRLIIWLLGLSAIAAVTFDFIKLLPLFNAFFIRDDYLFLDLGAFMRQQDPLAFLTATCIGWWRPIALLIPALGYLMFGLNPLPFHILAYVIHLLAGFVLILCCRRFFDLKVGFIAFTIYMTSPISFSNVGWMLGAIEDETACILYFLTLFTQFRKDQSKACKPYWIPVIFLVLGSFCKITWVGLIPALLFMDWVNYPQSAFLARLKRFLPFLILIVPIVLNFLIVGSHSAVLFENYYQENFNARNFIQGAFLSFIPSDFYYFIKDWFQVIIFVPIFFFVMALILSDKKKRIITIGIAYLSTLAILGLAQIQRDPVGWMMGWRHLTPLVGFAAILIATALTGLIGKLRLGYIGWLSVIVLLGLLLWLGLPMKKVLQDDILREEADYRQRIKSFVVLCRSFPTHNEIYIVKTKSISANLMADLAAGHDLCLLLVKRQGTELMHNYDARSNHIIWLEMGEMANLLDELEARSDVRFISTDDQGIWIDVTGDGVNEFNKMLKLKR